MKTKIVAILIVGLLALMALTSVVTVAEARAQYLRTCVDSDWTTTTTAYHVQAGSHVWTYYYTIVYNTEYRFANYGTWAYRGLGR